MAKHLDIPYVPELDNITYCDDLQQILDEHGQREFIAERPWAEFPYEPLTAFNIAHSRTHIYIDFFTRCNYLRAVNEANQSPVSQDSCVEFFVSPRPDSPLYFNLEFNCIGAVNASFRERRDAKTPLTDAQIDTILRIPSCGRRPFREIEGFFNWNLIVGIPLALLGVEYTPGQPVEMRGNFYKCAGATSAPHYLAWSPVHTERPDFHRPEFFGTLALL